MEETYLCEVAHLLMLLDFQKDISPSYFLYVYQRSYILCNFGKYIYGLYYHRHLAYMFSHGGVFIVVSRL